MATVQLEQSLPIILAEKLTKVYSAGRIQVTAVRGVSLAVERGEFVAIVGPSGSGKSTLFYLLGGPLVKVREPSGLAYSKRTYSKASNSPPSLMEWRPFCHAKTSQI